MTKKAKKDCASNDRPPLDLVRASIWAAVFLRERDKGLLGDVTSRGKRIASPGAWAVEEADKRLADFDEAVAKEGGLWHGQLERLPGRS